MLSVMTVADYLITYSLQLDSSNKYYPISNLRLQKLLYYVQGRSYMERKEPFFKEDFYAWRYGPVNKETYKIFSIYGSNEISQSSKLFKDMYSSAIQDISKIFVLLREKEEPNVFLENTKDRDIIHSVLEETKKFSNSQLVDHTHNEDPWKNTYDASINDCYNDNLISKDIIEKWFIGRKTLL